MIGHESAIQETGKAVTKLTSPFASILSDFEGGSIFRLQHFLLAGYTYFINFVILAVAFFLYSQQVLADM